MLRYSPSLQVVEDRGRLFVNRQHIRNVDTLLSYYYVFFIYLL